MSPAATSNTPEQPNTFGCVLSEDGCVEVSPLETRSMRVCKLPNSMNVLLVSDPTTDKAAAAINVSVGSFSDPWNIPGLAHFCEHMLFLGTEKYPDEGSYRKFLAENSGVSNAYTAMEDTNYHFQLVVPPNDLKSDNPAHVPRFKEALDRFSQFFSAPLFTESATERELNAIDSEHQKNLQRDGNRLFQLSKSCSNPKHPYSKFSTGSKQTLGTDAIAAGIDIRKELLEFHKKFYSANLMNLCIAGPYPLDVLEEWTVELFSDISNHDEEHPYTAYKDVEPLLPCHTGQLTYIESIKDVRLLELAWIIPSTEADYLSKSAFYVSHLLGHEGKGSLLSLLKNKAWANSLMAGPCKETKPFAFFSISIDLTTDGTNHVDDIIELLFSYLVLIKERGVQKWIHDETAAISKLSFHFQERSEPYSFVQGVSHSMYRFPPLHYLSGARLVREYKPDRIRELLDIMTPRKCTVLLMGKFVSDKTNTQEKWYKTRYAMEPIPDEKLLRWSCSKPCADLDIPPKNIFVPTDLNLIAEPLPSNEKDLEGPKVIEENDHFRLHYKLDRTFKRPKAVAYFDFITNVSYLSPRHSLLTTIFHDLVMDELNEFSYDADIAGLHYNMHTTVSGFRLTTYGYNHKLHMLLDTILDRIVKFQVDPERFRRILDTLRRCYMNFDKDQPYQHAMYACTFLLEQPRWHVREYLAVLDSDSITIEDVKRFASELTKRMFVIAMIGGNVSEQWAKEAMQSVVKKLDYSPLPRSEFNMRRVSKLPTEYEVLTRQTHRNPDDSNSAIKMMFQIGQRGNYAFDVLLELLSDILNKPTFHELRTVQQLGYMVFEGLTSYDNCRALYIIVQSTIADPDELLRRIRKFLKDVRKDTLETMDEQEFNGYVTSLIGLKAEREKKIIRQMNIYWSEILLRQFAFDRDQREIEALRSVTKKDVLDFFDKYIACTGSETRCLISMVYGNQHKQPPPLSEQGVEILEGAKQPVLLVRDPSAFRNWCPKYPISGTTLKDISRECKIW